MALFEVLMPQMGESITEATITRWLKNVGDHVAVEDPIVEVATDKVDSEIPAPVGGVIQKLLFAEGDVVEVGKPLALIETDPDKASDNVQSKLPHSKDENISKAPLIQVEISKTTLSAAPSGNVENGETMRYYSPLVKQIALTEGIDRTELDTIKGSGKDNRVTKDDILSYLEHKQKVKTNKDVQGKDFEQKSPLQNKKSPVKTILTDSGDQVIEISRVRKLIMDHMIASQATSVHVTSIVETDVTQLVKWREIHKNEFRKRYDINLTYMPAFLWAIAKTLKDYPAINASLVGDKIVIHKNINVGMATALPDGNLIVPVIKSADQHTLYDLAVKINDLANRARHGKLLPDDTQGGTFTITNIGSFGTLIGTPIINQPQLAILATGAIVKKPVVVETELGDTIAIRSMMYLSMSYDHRIIDGALGGLALKRIGEYLSQWDLNREI